MKDTSQNNFLIQSLAGLPRQILRQIDAMEDEMLTWQPDKNEWSVQMILAHLLHCEPFFQRRLQQIVTEDNPTVVGFGPAEAVPVSDETSLALLQSLRQARKTTLSQIYTYTPADWNRPAVHTHQGKTTLKGQIHTIVNHDIEHLGQIHDLLEMWNIQQNEQDIPERS